MKFYVPVPVFERESFKAMYTSLEQAKVVTDISSRIKFEHDICSAKDISVEYRHNKLIQQKWFKTNIYKSSKPLYIWDKDKRVHVSAFNGGMEKVKLLDVTLSNNPEHVLGIFYIIELSFWRDFTIQQILPWIAQHYNELISKDMRVIRLPDINGMILPSLLKVGLCKDAVTNTLNGYYLWNGSNSDIRNDLIFIRDNLINTTATKRKLGNNSIDYAKDINKHISLIEDQTIPVKESISDTPQTVDIEERISEDDEDEMSKYTPEAIIAKLGRKEASLLAQGIMNRLLE